MAAEELRERAHKIIEEMERLKVEIVRLKEDAIGSQNPSKELERAIGFLERAEMDMEKAYEKIHENTNLIAQWQKEKWSFVRAVQVELMLDEKGKITEISPDGCSFMIAEGVEPVGKYLHEIQCAGSPRVLGWYGPKPVVEYRALCESDSVITAAELKYIMPSLSLEETTSAA